LRHKGPSDESVLVRNTLHLLTGMAVVVAIFTAMNWSAMPVPQRLLALFFVAIVLHLWEEQRFPAV
jgi:hypothetical protein